LLMVKGGGKWKLRPNKQHEAAVSRKDIRLKGVWVE
jgi:hypothetical protein